MSNASDDPKQSTRRDFLKSSTTAMAAAAFAPYAAAGGFHLGGTETLKVGLVGCGGRGTGAAAQALRADPNTKLVALADTFKDHLESSLKTLQGTNDIADRVQVDGDHQFVGFDGYKSLIDSCDVVLLATTPHFRPLHVRAAVEAGKHLFVEKPISTDAPGVRSMMESGEMARKKGLNVVSGLCYRYERKKRELIQRVHDGAVGEIINMQCTYNTGGLWHRGHQPQWSEMEYQIRNWLYFTWLSGDHTAEQHIHSLDKIAWAMGDVYPVKCTASGGRIQRTDPKYGYVYDHFNTVFEWENGVKGFSSCRQWVGCSNDVSDYVFGTKGTAAIQGARIDGQNPWRWRDNTPDDMYQNEHDGLFAAIRKGEPINNTEYMCNSTLMAHMARMSAYTGQTITRDQALSSQEDFTLPSYEWGPAPKYEVAIPGETKFL